MAYRNFVPVYKAKMASTTPSLTEIFIPRGGITETAEEIDTTESGSGDGSAGQIGFGDVFPGTLIAEVKFEIMYRASGNVIANLAPRVEMEGVDVLLDRAGTNKWAFPYLLILTVDTPIEVKNGVWKSAFTAKSRGYYTRPAGS